jgi:hypothetical protein
MDRSYFAATGMISFACRGASLISYESGPAFQQLKHSR